MNETKIIEKCKIKNMNRLAKYRNKLVKKPILKDLFLEVTSRCNAHCEHCGSNCGNKIDKNEVSADVLKNALLEIANNYKASEIILNVTGGEPLMRKDLFDIMEYASNLGFRWGMTTNGMLINDEVIALMEKTNMESISISLDGLKETHESFRKVPNCYENILENIKKLKHVPCIKVVQITTVVNKKNINELEDLYKLMQDMNVVSWRVINVDPIGRAKDNTDLLLDKEEYIYLFDFIKRVRNEKKIENVEYGCSHFLGLEYEKEIRDEYFICAAGLYVASILSNGDIYVCPDVERRDNLIQGNIKTDKFVEIWENKFEYFRSGKKRKSNKCQKCKNWKWCLGDSLHTWNFETSTPNFCIKDIKK